MNGQRALRTCMQALVLLNLVFVLMTGAAGLHWLAPLFALTLGAPLLERLREKLAYRLLWNGAAVCLLFVLLRHALQADLAYVREDGLVMAVLCQVHLLNNLRSNQRPDLLFFNAFLIAIITGFMNRGVGFPIAFLAFAPCFVFGLQLLNATRNGHALSPALTRRHAADGLKRSAAILALSLLAFVAWPRDFQRKALLSGMIDLKSGESSRLEIGFNEELLLNRAQALETSDRPAMRVTVLEGDGTGVSPLWRGGTLAETEGGAWRSPEAELGRGAKPVDRLWRRRRGRLVRAQALEARPAAAIVVEVVRHAQESQRLFAPLEACELVLAAEHAGESLRSRRDATVDSEGRGEVRYELVLVPGAGAEPGGRYGGELPEELLPFTDLPEDERTELALELALRLAARLPEEAQQHELVASLSDYLSRNYTYLAPGTPGAATSLDEFLRGESGGHCEFFASALATMLRGLGMPCRVVTGFRSSRWDAQGRELYFGTRNAHAWVEVHDPQAGWVAVDPSPIQVGQAPRPGFLALLRGRASTAWQAVTGFDAERRAALSAWALALPARAATLTRERPFEAALVFLLLAVLVALFVHRSRARLQPGIRAYRRDLRRAGLRLAHGETPRELLVRARTEGLAPERVTALEAATRAHEATRYAA